MQDVPKDLLAEIQRLEKMFIVPVEKLKEITTHFVGELTKGKATHLFSMDVVLIKHRSFC
jgi:hexokinase